jgi:antitoxin component of RelBE/YafQ-DinJ toxin-antitoxin module
MKYIITVFVPLLLGITYALTSKQVQTYKALPHSSVVQSTDSSLITVVQMLYFAQPGKEQEVLDVRLQACAILEKMGITSGRVLTRINNARAIETGDIPDVTWLGEFANTKSLKAYEEIAGKNEEFLAKRQKMSTLTRKVERRYWQVR